LKPPGHTEAFSIASKHDNVLLVIKATVQPPGQVLRTYTGVYSIRSGTSALTSDSPSHVILCTLNHKFIGIGSIKAAESSGVKIFPRKCKGGGKHKVARSSKSWINEIANSWFQAQFQMHTSCI